MLFGVKVGKMDSKKDSKNIPAKKSCNGSREINSRIPDPPTGKPN